MLSQTIDHHVIPSIDTYPKSLQAQVLEDVSIKRQKIESLLEDNLFKRKRELEEEGAALLS